MAPPTGKKTKEQKEKVSQFKGVFRRISQFRNKLYMGEKSGVQKNNYK